MLLNLNDFKRAVPAIMAIAERNINNTQRELATMISASTHIPLIVVYKVMMIKYGTDFSEDIEKARIFYQIDKIIDFDSDI